MGTKTREEIEEILRRGEVVMSHSGQMIKSPADIPPSSELLGPNASPEDRERAVRAARLRLAEAERDLADLDPHAITTAGAQTRVRTDTSAAELRDRVLRDDETPNSALDFAGEAGETTENHPQPGATQRAPRGSQARADRRERERPGTERVGSQLTGRGTGEAGQPDATASPATNKPAENNPPAKDQPGTTGGTGAAGNTNTGGGSTTP